VIRGSTATAIVRGTLPPGAVVGSGTRFVLTRSSPGTVQLQQKPGTPAIINRTVQSPAGIINKTPGQVLQIHGVQEGTVAPGTVQLQQGVRTPGGIIPVVKGGPGTSGGVQVQTNNSNTTSATGKQHTS
jgi:hypothetical protein